MNHFCEQLIYEMCNFHIPKTQTIKINKNPMQNYTPKKIIIYMKSYYFASSILNVTLITEFLIRSTECSRALYEGGLKIWVRLVIPKVRYSEHANFLYLVRRFVNPNICSIIPKVRYSEGSLFRRFVIPKVRFSENEIGFDIRKVR